MLFYKYHAKTKLSPTEVMEVITENIYNMPWLANLSADVGKFEGVIGNGNFTVGNASRFLMGHCVISGEIKEEPNDTSIVFRTRLPMEDLIVLIPCVCINTLGIFNALWRMEYLKLLGCIGLLSAFVAFFGGLYLHECNTQMKKFEKFEKLLKLREIKRYK